MKKQRIRGKPARRIRNSGYSGGGANSEKPTLKSFQPQHWSAKSDIDLNLSTLRNRAADLVMNSPIGSAAVVTSTANVISSGLKIFPRLKPKALGITPEEAVEWSRTTKLEFELWANSINCDYYRRNNFNELQRIAYYSYLMDGDCFCLFKRRYPTRDNPYSLRLQLIESGRVSNPINSGKVMFGTSPYGVEMKNPNNGNRIINGVEVDSSGQLQAVWISNRIWNEPFSTDSKIEWQRVKIFGEETGKRNILHVCYDLRTEQYRGVPFLAPVIESIKQVSRYSDAELVSAVIKSFFSIFFTQDVTTAGFELNQILPDNEEETDEKIAQVMREYKLGAGTVTSLPRGVDVKAIDRSNAQSTFDPFINAFLKQIGSALNIPLEVLIKQFQSSYSASRAALLQAEDEFRQRRIAFVNDFCQPIYENFLTEAVATGRITAAGYFEDIRKRGLWSSADWYVEGSHLLDVTKELQGAQMRIALGLTTHAQEAAELCGTNYYENLEILSREYEMREKLLPNVPENPMVQPTVTEKETPEDSPNSEGVGKEKPTSFFSGEVKA